mmetsp:Transcript_144965/g.255522  ORF Transcript_144965/g.255522 Transcript_144965/m.255522 type:complete len:243 (-) Transcript_144965:743-1471(-)
MSCATSLPAACAVSANWLVCVHGTIWSAAPDSKRIGGSPARSASRRGETEAPSSAGHCSASVAGSKPKARRPKPRRPPAKTVRRRAWVVLAVSLYSGGTNALGTRKYFPAGVGSQVPFSERSGANLRDSRHVAGQLATTAAGNSEPSIGSLLFGSSPVASAVASRPPAESPATMMREGSMLSRPALLRVHRKTAHASSMHPATPAPLFVTRYDALRQSAPCEASQAQTPTPRMRSPKRKPPE